MGPDGTKQAVIVHLRGVCFRLDFKEKNLLSSRVFLSVLPTGQFQLLPRTELKLSKTLGSHNTSENKRRGQKERKLQPPLERVLQLNIREQRFQPCTSNPQQTGQFAFCCWWRHFL